MFRRNSTQSAEPEAEVTVETPDQPEAQAGVKGRTPGKGRPTPKRSSVQGRKAPEPPPANRREAAKRAREVRMADRAEERAGMLRGDEKYLLPRDKGPERRLARDIVDSRRNVGTWFFAAALLILVGTNPVWPRPVQSISQMLWLAVAVLFVIDAVVLSRKVRKLVWERFPKTTQGKAGLFMYAVMRSITFRKLRMPKPQVKVGDPI
ncbi:DUF3043 domain-containing protein [Longispora albida]|uniref:DUF3043 domain-containing protein n=1 Tax=Longispora albida TaxID=203523 RepID=UPI00035D30C9|nr:DUF3043 domain-containing protein [Longispora albida]